MIEILIVIGVLFVAAIAGAASLRVMIQICAPNEVLIISGRTSGVGERTVGYRLVKGGRGVRLPLLEQVDRLDLTNMVVEVAARNAYTKGGVALMVQGVANVKIAGHEPLLDNAIERFLGRPREEVMKIAKATLEGSLRGILATLTPEQVNEDRILFAEKLVQQVEQDMTSLGLVVDTLKIQNVHDEQGYLDSIGRKKNAEVLKRARIAEAQAKADSIVRGAENREREASAKITAEIAVKKADAQRRLTDALTRRDALVAEEQAAVAAKVAQSTAEIAVQKARIEQVRAQLDAEVIQPAKAQCAASENAAKAAAAPILQDGRARAEVLHALAESWRNAGPNAREIFVMQKLDAVVKILTSLVAETSIGQVTMIDARAPGLGSGGSDFPLKAISSLEQLKQVFGVDLLARLRTGEEHAALAVGATRPKPAQAPAAPSPSPSPPATAPREAREAREAREPAKKDRGHP
jgi:flotillin